MICNFKLLGRRAPFGHEVLAFLQGLPQYNLSIEVDDISSFNGKKSVSVTLTVNCSLVEALKITTNSRQRSKFPGMTTILTTTSDFDFVDFRRIAYVPTFTKTHKNILSSDYYALGIKDKGTQRASVIHCDGGAVKTKPKHLCAH